ncbi:hypothetical protein HanPSC8_Chr11g0463951 [Helianthus annuus]|nr:hypothetical protein HanPSC8_Chr11g0463951 [Helianthus annuus]
MKQVSYYKLFSRRWQYQAIYLSMGQQVDFSFLLYYRSEKGQMRWLISCLNHFVVHGETRSRPSHHIVLLRLILIHLLPLYLRLLSLILSFQISFQILLICRFIMFSSKIGDYNVENTLWTAYNGRGDKLTLQYGPEVEGPLTEKQWWIF